MGRGAGTNGHSGRRPPVSLSLLSHTQGDYLCQPHFSLFAALGNADQRRWGPPLPHDQRGRGHTGSHRPRSPGSARAGARTAEGHEQPPRLRPGLGIGSPSVALPCVPCVTPGLGTRARPQSACPAGVRPQLPGGGAGGHRGLPTEAVERHVSDEMSSLGTGSAPTAPSETPEVRELPHRIPASPRVLRTQELGVSTGLPTGSRRPGLRGRGCVLDLCRFRETIH